PVGDPVEGLRVATRVGCNGCHGADGAGKQLWEEEGKFKLYSANLTEKRALYDDPGIEALLRQGRTHDGHVPYGMPIQMYQHLSDREVRDITAWLRSIPAVAHPELKPSWFSDELKRQIEDGSAPYLDDMRPDPGNLPPAEPPTETLALGKHLAMTSCTECHGRDLNGFSGEDAPSLVVAKAYSNENFMRLMRTGITATGKASASGLMTQIGSKRMPSMTDDEVRALKAYLDSR
ncbi:MAG: c-type cytochrome, partial [Frankiaceae bacterium]|nr:c-type cytochrome [Arenimonas sp.]